MYNYDSLGQVSSAKRHAANGDLAAGQQYEYEFDEIGNRMGVGRGGTQLGGLRRETYANNALNQITSRTVPGYVDVLGKADVTATVSVNLQPATARQNSAWWKEFPLDNSSSAVWQSLTNLSVTPQAGAALDKVTNIVGNVYLPQTPELFSYDADGNLTNDGRWVYTWDAENRLVKAESMSSAPVGSKRRVEFAYDFASRMVRRTEYDGSSGSYTLTNDLKYFYDGLRCMQEHNITSGLIHRSYVWGVDLSGSMGGAGGVGGLLSVVLHNQGSASGGYYPWYDSNGNILGYVTSTNSSTRATYEYSPFGEMIRAEGDLAKLFPYRFSTKRYDDTLDLVQYEYRFYKLATGTWLSRDPIEERGGKNLYVFVANDIPNRFDYLGLHGKSGASSCCVSTHVKGEPAGPAEVLKAERAEVAIELKAKIIIYADGEDSVIDIPGGLTGWRPLLDNDPYKALCSFKYACVQKCKCLGGVVEVKVHWQGAKNRMYGMVWSTPQLNSSGVPRLDENGKQIFRNATCHPSPAEIKAAEEDCKRTSAGKCDKIAFQVSPNPR